MPERNARAIVTGGCGFIGSHLTELLLDEGLEVLVIDNLATGRLENLAHRQGDKNLSIVEADVRDAETIDALFEGAQLVFHLAALADIVPSIERPTEYLQTNVDGTVNALVSAQRCGVRRFIYAASSSCYGVPDQFPTPESSPPRPQYPYALSKLLGEQCVLHWGQVYRLPVLSLRLFNVFGPRSRTAGSYGAVFGTFLRQKLAQRPFTVVGDGEQTRDFVFVTDVARAFWAAACADTSREVYNVGSGRPHSVNRLVELLGGEKVQLPRRPGEPDCTHADISRIEGALGWAPTVSFEQGVERVLEQIDYWREAPLWDEQSIGRATASWFKYLSSDRERD
jgi:UDP-glucose 4-epimerase